MRGTMVTVFGVLDRKTNNIEFVKDALGSYDFKRWLATNFLRNGSILALYPEDFDVYRLFDVNPETRTLNSDSPFQLVCNVSDLFDEFKIARPDVARSSDEA